MPPWMLGVLVLGVLFAAAMVLAFVGARQDTELWATPELPDRVPFGRSDVHLDCLTTLRQGRIPLPCCREVLWGDGKPWWPSGEDGKWLAAEVKQLRIAGLLAEAEQRLAEAREQQQRFEAIAQHLPPDVAMDILAADQPTDEDLERIAEGLRHNDEGMQP